MTTITTMTDIIGGDGATIEEGGIPTGISMVKITTLTNIPCMDLIEGMETTGLGEESMEIDTATIMITIDTTCMVLTETITGTTEAIEETPLKDTHSIA